MKKYSDHLYADCPDPKNHHKAAHRLITMKTRKNYRMCGQHINASYDKCTDLKAHVLTEWEYGQMQNRAQKEMANQHTPTPWTFSPMGMIIARTVTDDDGDNLVLGSMNNPENAAFIVRAVNCYEELLEALRNFRDKGIGYNGPDLNKLIAKAEGK